MSYATTLEPIRTSSLPSSSVQRLVQWMMAAGFDLSYGELCDVAAPDRASR
jgi:hypothetical protein